MLTTSSFASSFKITPIISPPPHRRSPPTIKCSTATAPPLPKLSSTTATTTTLYEVLRVDQRASAVEIKNAYRALAKLYHPDVVKQHPEADANEFVEIRSAYDTLSDPMARAVYDLGLRRRRAGGVRGGVRWGVVGKRWETDQCW